MQQLIWESGAKRFFVKNITNDAWNQFFESIVRKGIRGDYDYLDEEERIVDHEITGIPFDESANLDDARALLDDRFENMLQALYSAGTMMRVGG